MLRLLLMCGDKSPVTKKHAERANSGAITALVGEATALGCAVAKDSDTTLQTRLKLVAGVHVALMRQKAARIKADAEKAKSGGDSAEASPRSKICRYALSQCGLITEQYLSTSHPPKRSV